MSYTSLISTTELAAHPDNPDWAILDCRYSLTVPGRGRSDYQAAHIPGAVYVHLDNDLCAPMIPGKTGRHPLAPMEKLVENFSSWGIGDGVQVVVYDDWPGGSGAIAARLWWTLRYLGHQDVAVLDGGWVRWWSEGHPLQSGEDRRPKRVFTPRPRPELIASSDEVDQMRTDPSYRLFDSRSADRYRGENETIDPVAGHIPGAISAPYEDNVGPGGLFLPPETLRKRFLALLGDVPANRAVFYCGSGVTATHNLVALARAGLGDARLYIGSWSEWITDPQRPVSR
jgi:thiosulfate/3-mercaptopyruvate sulfurtransferase